MKNILVAAMLLATVPVMAGSGKSTASIKVWGNCEMCERTIEKAAKIPGVASADWDTETKMLRLKYNDAKTSTEAVEKSIAAAGYDTEHFTGNQAAYDKLHSCCQYERKK